jgi:hypothetical protein
LFSHAACSPGGLRREPSVPYQNPKLSAVTAGNLPREDRSDIFTANQDFVRTFARHYRA